MKEAWHKRANAAWFCFYEVPRTDKFIAAESRQLTGMGTCDEELFDGDRFSIGEIKRLCVTGRDDYRAM